MRQQVEVELHTSFNLIGNSKNLFGSEDVCNCYGYLVIHLGETSRTFGFSINYLFSPLCRIDLSSRRDNFNTKRYVQNMMLTIFKAIFSAKHWDLATGEIKELPDDQIELSLLLYRRILSQFRDIKYLLRSKGRFYNTITAFDKLSSETIEKLKKDGCKNFQKEEANLVDEFLKRLSEMLNK